MARNGLKIGTIEGGTAMVDIEGKTPKGSYFQLRSFDRFETTVTTVP